MLSDKSDSKDEVEENDMEEFSDTNEGIDDLEELDDEGFDLDENDKGTV